MEINITTTVPLTIKNGTTVGELKQEISKKLKLPNESIIVDIDANYNVKDDTVIIEHNHAEFRLKE